MGYLRQDKRKGIRNRLLIVYTVDCSFHVAYKIWEHFYCGSFCEIDIVGQRSCHDHQNRIDMLLSYCVHPNIGGVLVIGNGCESTRGDEIAAFARKNGRPAEWFTLQDAGGTEKGIEQGISTAKQLIEAMKSEEILSPFGFRDLNISAKCGGSDFTSGLVANPVVGCLFDKLVDLGATCLFAEMNEALGLREQIVLRGKTARAKNELARTYDKAEQICKQMNQFFIRPGNIAGGLTTIEEKSISSYSKSGTKPIEGVLKIAQKPPHSGLWHFDEAPDEFYIHQLDHEGNQGGDCAVMMLMNTVGTQVNLLITGRGHTCGTGIAPTIKITGNAQTYNMMSDDIDYCANSVLTEGKKLTDAADELMETIIGVCQGKNPHADRLGHRENEIWSVAQTNRKLCKPTQQPIG
jgi:altronate hydrolase